LNVTIIAKFGKFLSLRKFFFKLSIFSKFISLRKLFEKCIHIFQVYFFT
jgi:hypothetical protein